jgi:hypothetical protein
MVYYGYCLLVPLVLLKIYSLDRLFPDPLGHHHYQLPPCTHRYSGDTCMHTYDKRQ